MKKWVNPDKKSKKNVRVRKHQKQSKKKQDSAIFPNEMRSCTLACWYESQQPKVAAAGVATRHQQKPPSNIQKRKLFIFTCIPNIYIYIYAYPYKIIAAYSDTYTHDIDYYYVYMLHFISKSVASPTFTAIFSFFAFSGEFIFCVCMLEKPRTQLCVFVW